MSSEVRKQVIVFAVLLVVLAGVVIWQMTKGPDTPTSNASQTNTAEAAGQTNSATGSSAVGSRFQETDVDIKDLIQNVREVEFNYDEEGSHRNPMAAILPGFVDLDPNLISDTFEVATPADLLYAANRKELTGIIWNEDKPLAIIDNDVVGVGHRFWEPIVVKSIEPTRVVLAIDGQDVEVVKELKEQ